MKNSVRVRILLNFILVIVQLFLSIKAYASSHWQNDLPSKESGLSSSYLKILEVKDWSTNHYPICMDSNVNVKENEEVIFRNVRFKAQDMSIIEEMDWNDWLLEVWIEARIGMVRLGSSYLGYSGISCFVQDLDINETSFVRCPNRGEFRQKLLFKGTVENVNQAMQSLTYKPPDYFNGRDHLQIAGKLIPSLGIKYTEQDIELFNQKMSSWKCAILVEAVVTPPLISFSNRSVAIDEDTSFVFGDVFGITIIDMDVMPLSSLMTVHIRAKLGQLNGNSCCIDFRGTLSTLSAFVNNLKYIPLKDSNILTHGRDIINVTVRYSSADSSSAESMKSKTEYLSVVLNPVNDAPILVSSNALIANHHSPTQINVVLEDIDWNENDLNMIFNNNLMFEVFCDWGLLSLIEGQIEMKMSFDTLETQKIAGKGTIHQVQDLLSSGILYTAPFNATISEDIITVIVYDGGRSGSGGNKSSTITFPVAIDPSEPTLVMSSILELSNYTVSGNSTVYLPPFSLWSPFSLLQETPLVVRVSCDHGQLTLPVPSHSAGLSPEEKISAMSIKFERSNYDEISSILGNVLYTPKDAYAGYEEIFVEIALALKDGNGLDRTLENADSSKSRFRFYVLKEMNEILDVQVARDFKFEPKTLFFIGDFLHFNGSKGSELVEISLSVIEGALFLPSCLMRTSDEFQIIQGELDSFILDVRIGTPVYKVSDLFSFVQYYSGKLDDTLFFQIRDTTSIIHESTFTLGIDSNGDTVSLFASTGESFHGYEDNDIPVPGLVVDSISSEASIIKFHLLSSHGHVLLPLSRDLIVDTHNFDLQANGGLSRMIQDFDLDLNSGNPLFVVRTFPVLIPIVAEIQSFSCTTTNPLASFRLSLFGEATELIASSDTVSPKFLPRCRRALDGSSFPSPCAGDGSTFLEKLEKLDFIESVSVGSHSHDRVCVNDLNAFSYPISITFNPRGDLPLLTPIDVYDDDISFYLSEEVKGTVPVQHEVQKVSCDCKVSNASFKMKFINDFMKPISCESSPEEVRRAIEGLQFISNISVTKTSSSLSRTWFVTFAQAGDIQELNIVQLSGDHLNFTVHEVVKGTAPMWGDFSLALVRFNETQYTRPLNFDVSALEMERVLNKLSLGSLAKVRKESNILSPSGSSWRINLNDGGNTKVSLVHVNLDAPERNEHYTSCACLGYELSQHYISNTSCSNYISDIWDQKSQQPCNSSSTQLIDLSISSSFFSVYGTSKSVSESLSSLIFRGMENWNSGLHDDNATIFVNFGEDKLFTSSDAMLSVNVIPVNDYPLLHCKRRMFFCFEDLPCHIHGVSVSDPDINDFMEHSLLYPMSLTIEVSNGIVDVKASDDIGIESHATNLTHFNLTVTGTIKSLNRALSSLSFKPRENWSSCEIGCVNEIQLVRVILYENTTTVNNFIIGTSSTNHVTLPFGISDVDFQTKLQSLSRIGNITVSVISSGEKDIFEYEITFHEGSDAFQLGDHDNLFSIGLGSVLVEVVEKQKGKGIPSILAFSIDDMGNIGEGKSLKSSELISINVLPVNDVPTIFVEKNCENIVTLEDEALDVSGLGVQVSDIDNEHLSLTASVSCGKLSNETGNWESLDMINSSSIINQILQSITFVPPANYNGLCALSLSVSDFQKHSKRSIPINILPVDDSPEIIMSRTEIVTESSRQTKLTGLQVIDFDVLDEWSNSLTLTVSARNGYLDTYINQDKEFTMTGSPDIINHVLSQLEYRSEPNFSGEDMVTLDLVSGEHIVNASMKIIVESVNIKLKCTPPSWGVIELFEDSTWISSENETFSVLLQVQGGDFDQASTKFDVFLSTMYGTAHSNPFHMKLNDSFSDLSLFEIKEVLNSIVYTPPPDKNGFDTMTVSIYGSRGKILADATQYFSIVPVEDPVEIFVPNNMTSIPVVRGHTVNLPAIRISDRDVNDKIDGSYAVVLFESNVLCLHGKLDLDEHFFDNFSTFFRRCSTHGSEQKNLCLVGDLNVTNGALAKLRYSTSHLSPRTSDSLFNDTITVMVYELHDNLNKKISDSHGITLNIHLEESHAQIILQSHNFIIDEDSSLIISPQFLVYNSVDSSRQMSFNLKISCSHCRLTSLVYDDSRNTEVVGHNSSILLFEGVDREILSKLSTNGFQYFPISNFFGSDKVLFHLLPLHESSNSTFVDISVIVNPVFDPPSIFAADIVSEEDNNVVISNMRVDYAESQNAFEDQLCIRIRVLESIGKLYFNKYPGIYESSHNNTVIEIKGLAEVINKAISSGHLIFAPHPEWFGTFNFSISALVGSLVYDEVFVEVIIQHVYDFPKVLISPGAIEWQTLKGRGSFEDLSISVEVEALEVDSNQIISCNVSVTSGAIIRLDTDIFPIATGEVLMFRKPLSMINYAFNDILYSPQHDYVGVDSISIICHDGNYSSPTESLSIYVPPMRSPPLIDVGVTSVDITGSECSLFYTLLHGVYLTGLGVYPQSERNMISLKVTSSIGLCFKISKHKEFMESVISYMNCETIHFTGSIDAVNSALRSLDLCVADNIVSSGSFIFEAKVWKEFDESPDTTSLSIPFEIHHPWRSPSIKVINGTSLYVTEGTSLELGDNIQIEADRKSQQLKLFVKVLCQEAGKLSLPVFEYNNLDDRAITIIKEQGDNNFIEVVGPLELVQRSVKHLRFIPSLHWFGYLKNTEGIYITLSDERGLSVSTSFPLFISPVNSPPRILLRTPFFEVPSHQSVNIFEEINILVEDDDIKFIPDFASTPPFDVSVKTKSGGFLSFENRLDGCILDDDAKWDTSSSTVSIQGDIHMINAAFKLLIYSRCDSCYGGDKIHIIVNDAGNYGSGGALSTSIELAIRGNINFQYPISSRINEFAEHLSSSKQHPSQDILLTGIDSKTNITDVGDIAFNVSSSFFNVKQSTPISFENIKIDHEEFHHLVGLSIYMCLINTWSVEILSHDQNSSSVNGTFTLRFNGKQSSPLSLSSLLSDVYDQLSKLTENPIQVIESIYGWTITSFCSDVEASLTFDESNLIGGHVELRHLKKAYPQGRFHLLEAFHPGVVLPEDATNMSTTFLLQGLVTPVNEVLKSLVLIPSPDVTGLIYLHLSAGVIRDITTSNSFKRSLFGSNSTQFLRLEIEQTSQPPKLEWNNVDVLSNSITDIDCLEDAFLSFEEVSQLRSQRSGLRLSSSPEDEGRIIHLSLSSSFGTITTFYNQRQDNIEWRDIIELNNTTGFINEALKSLAYKPSPNWWGVDEISINLCVQNFTLNSKIQINVIPSNDKPIILRYNEILDSGSPLYLNGIEDTPLGMSGFSVMDNDKNYFIEYEHEDKLEIIVQVKNGIIHNSERMQPGIQCHDEPSNESFTYRKQGNVDEINEFLANLSYIPICNFYGNTTITMKLKDFGLGASYTLDSLSSDILIYVKVEGVNDTPLLHFPKELGEVGRLIVLEDTYGSIGRMKYVKNSGWTSENIYIMSEDSLSISDMDLIDNTKENIKVSISCLHGTLSLRNYDGSVDFISGTGKHDTNLSIQGSIESINKNLQGLIYRGSLNYNSRSEGQENMTVSVLDSSGANATFSFIVYVQEINDDPVVEFLHGEGKQGNELCLHNHLSNLNCESVRVTESFTAEANTFVPIQGISVRDIDKKFNSGDLDVEIFVNMGRAKINQLVSQVVFLSDSNFSKYLRLRGTVENLNKALDTLLYLSNSTIDHSDTLTVIALDPIYTEHEYPSFKTLEECAVENPSQNRVDIPIFIHGLAILPSIDMQTWWQIEEDTPTNIPKFSIKGHDFTQVNLTITCSAGSIIVQQNHETILSNFSAFVSESTFSGWGTIQSWNLAMNSVIYIPDFNHNTYNNKADSITFELIGNNELYIKHVLYIDVEPVNDAPQIEVNNPVPLQLFEDEDFVVSCQIQDVDIVPSVDLNQFFSVTVSVTNGSIKITNAEGVWFLNDINDMHRLEFKATLDTMNIALNQMVYCGNSNFYGDDTVQIFVSDNGNVGKGGKLTSAHQIALNVLPVNDKPILYHEIGPLICQPNTWCMIGNNANLKLDDPDSLSVTIDVEVFVESGHIYLLSNSIPENLAKATVQKTLSMRGNLTEINKTFAQLAYYSQSSNSNDILYLAVHSDGGYDGCQHNCEHQAAKSEIFLVVTEVHNSSPVVNMTGPTMGGILSCIEDEVCLVQGLSIVDIDSSTAKVEISAENGLLTVSDNWGNLQLFVETSDSSLKLIGSIHVINTFLRSLKYESRHNFFGNDVLRISVSDLSGGWSSTSINIDVCNSVDKSYISLPSSVANVKEDTLFPLRGATVIHPDTQINAGPTLMVELRVISRNGRFRLNSNFGINTSTIKFDQNFNFNPEKQDLRWLKDVTLEGILSDVNNAIQEISFVGDLNWNSDSKADDDCFLEFFSRTINPDYSNSDGDSIGIDQYDDNARIVFAIEAVNDPPELIFREELEINCNAYEVNCMTDDGLSPKRISLDVITLNEDDSTRIPVQVRDVDNDLLIVTIYVTSGFVSILNIREPPEVYLQLYLEDEVMFLSGTGYMDTLVKFKGTESSINKKLENLVFYGDQDLYGDAYIEIIAEDSNGQRTIQNVTLNILPILDDVHFWFPFNVRNEKIITYIDEGRSVKLNQYVSIPESFKSAAKTEEELQQLLEIGGLQMKDLGEGTGLYQAFALWTPDVIFEHQNTRVQQYNVTISVDKGNLRLETILSSIFDSVMFHVYDEFGNSVRFSGSLRYINIAAGFISFFTEDNSSETGLVKLSVRIDPLPLDCNDKIYAHNKMQCYWTSKPQSIEESRELFIIAVNSPPQIHWTPFNESKSLIRQFTSYNACEGSREWYDIGSFQISDTDIGKDGIMTVLISLLQGNIRLSSITDLTFSEGDGYHGTISQPLYDGSKMSSKQIMRFDGGLVAINRGLSRIQYSNCDILSGNDSEFIEITIEIDDNGFTGKGGSLKSSKTVKVII